MNKIGVISFLVMIILFSCRSGAEVSQSGGAQTQKAAEQNAGQTAASISSPAETTASPAAPDMVPDTDAARQTDSSAPFGAPQAAIFDPSTISQEEKDTARTEIQQLIQRLNGIIRAKNYNSWVSYLGNDYFATISSPEYLDRTSKSAVLVKQRIVLRSARDYFNHVVVPSRTNDRVDDIEYVSPIRVKAYTFNNKGEKLRLYDLEKNSSEWKIIN